MSHYRPNDRSSRYRDRDQDSHSRHRDDDRDRYNARANRGFYGQMEAQRYHSTASPPMRPICYNCGRPGHYRPNCPDLKVASKQSNAPSDVISIFAAQNPGLLEEFIEEKAEREKIMKRDKEFQLLKDAVRAGNQPLIDAMTPPHRPKPAFVDYDDVVAQESPTKKRRIDTLALQPSPKTALLKTLSSQIRELKASVLTPSPTVGRSGGLNFENTHMVTTPDGNVRTPLEQRVSPREEELQKQVLYLRNEMHEKEKASWEVVKAREMQMLQVERQYAQLRQSVKSPQNPFVHNDEIEQSVSNQPAPTAGPSELDTLNTRLLEVEERVKRKRYLLEKIKQAEEEEARLGIDESAASMKMQENELREDAIRSVLLKQLTMIDQPTPLVLQKNGMSAESAPTAPIVTATIVDDNIGSNGFGQSDCLQPPSPCDNNGVVDPSNQEVPAPKILSPLADALPQRQRSNRAR